MRVMPSAPRRSESLEAVFESQLTAVTLPAESTNHRGGLRTPGGLEGCSSSNARQLSVPANSSPLDGALVTPRQARSGLNTSI
jgi:hypothetical protein